MFKITDSTGAISETIPAEIAKSVGVWADMISNEHSKDDDESVGPNLASPLMSR